MIAQSNRHTPLLMLMMCILFSMAQSGQADEGNKEELPEPLTLPYALSLADSTHPELEMQRAKMVSGEAEQLSAAAAMELKAGVEARLMAIEPSYKSLNSSRNGSSIKLKLSKQLYDGGQSALALAAEEHEQTGRELDYLDARQKRYLDILARYFDVLLADMRYLRDDELMTVAFLRWSKLQDVVELGRVSDIDLLEKESVFRKLFRQRVLRQNQQRATRSRLAMSLNRPGELSAELEMPALQSEGRELGDYNELVAAVLVNNPQLKGMRAKLLGAQSRSNSAQAGGGMTIRGEVEMAAYNRTTGSSHPLSAGLVLEIPLSSSASVDAAKAKQRGRYREQKALMAQKEMDIRQAVLDLWLEVSELKAEQEEVEVLGDYRELSLDRSRGLYEHELKSDIGNAAAMTADYQLRKKEVEFKLALAWARLDALNGRLLAAENGGNSGE